MLQALNTHPTHWPGRVLRALHYAGPERRDGSGPLARLMTQMMDEIDYGLVLLTQQRQVLHLNHAARTELTEQHPLQLLGCELRARSSRDAAPLHEALEQAATRGLRRVLKLGDGAQSVGISVVPLGADPTQPEAEHATLLVLGRRQVCGALAAQGFARAHQLSPGEEQVLRGLCEGLSPQLIAMRHRVKIATVRTQISSIRTKTGCDSIRDLVQKVAVLPPMVGALRQAPPPHEPSWARELAAA